MSRQGDRPADLDRLLAIMPFAAAIGIALESATPQQVTGRLAWSAGLCTAGGVLHGGALMTLADSLGALCAYLNLPDGAATATISSFDEFPAPGPGRTGARYGAAGAHGPVGHRRADGAARRRCRARRAGHPGSGGPCRQVAGTKQPALAQ